MAIKRFAETRSSHEVWKRVWEAQHASVCLENSYEQTLLAKYWRGYLPILTVAAVKIIRLSALNVEKMRSLWYDILGHPDLWLKKYNTAIFIHGCFWHRHQGCKFAYTPKSRIEFWTKKFERNISRDSEIKRELANKGIRCLVVWECSIKNARKKTGCPDKLLENITAFLHGDALYLEVWECIFVSTGGGELWLIGCFFPRTKL